MKRVEFLEQLQKELSDELSSAELREEIEYYNQYIEVQMSAGTPEEQVVEELGDPWAIARNILDEKVRREGTDAARREQAARDAERDRQEKRGADLDREYARQQRQGGAGAYILVLVAVLLIIGIIVTVFFGVMGFLIRELPVLFVILVIWWVVRRLRY